MNSDASSFSRGIPSRALNRDDSAVEVTTQFRAPARHECFARNAT